MTFPSITQMWLTMSPFTPSHYTCFMDKKTHSIMKFEWDTLAKEHNDRLERTLQDLSIAIETRQTLLNAGKTDENYLELRVPVRWLKLQINHKKPLAEWIDIENQVCIAFFEFLETQMDPILRSKAIEAAPTLPIYSHRYTPEVQRERIAYWKDLTEKEMKIMKEQWRLLS